MIVLAAMAFAGCKNNGKETNFIPTPMVTPDTEEDEEPEDTKTDEEEDTGEASNEEEEPIISGETTTKYVKLGGFDAILNVRSSPSTDGDNIVGFLVHTEKVEVMKIENGWASFLYQGEIRYVSADYLVDTVPAYISPPTLSPTPSPTPSPAVDPDAPPPEI